MTEPQSIDAGIWALWRRCLTTAHDVGEVPASAVEDLIRTSREIISEMGYSRRDGDLILFGVYANVHWDWQHPTARIFEALLEFELQEFFSERIHTRVH